MKVRVGLLLTMALAGCSQEGAVQDAIKSRLKDPGSAQFQRVLVSDKGDSACAIWNARNSFGGYGEWTATGLSKVESGWQISDPTISPERCTEWGINAMDRLDEAKGRLDKALGR